MGFAQETKILSLGARWCSIHRQTFDIVEYGAILCVCVYTRASCFRFFGCDFFSMLWWFPMLFCGALQTQTCVRSSCTEATESLVSNCKLCRRRVYCVISLAFSALFFLFSDKNGSLNVFRATTFFQSVHLRNVGDNAQKKCEVCLCLSTKKIHKVFFFFLERKNQ
jgi:hypothetical protein